MLRLSSVEETWGPATTLVASAGTSLAAPVLETTDEEWQRMLDLNLTAPSDAPPGAAVDGRARAGRLVVIASVAAKVGEPYIAAYTASKHGVLGLVRSAAAEVARSGVTVNAVCPGYVDTPMTDATVPASGKTGRTEAEARAPSSGKQPIGRLITPDEVAAAGAACVTNGGDHRPGHQRRRRSRPVMTTRRRSSYVNPPALGRRAGSATPSSAEGTDVSWPGRPPSTPTASSSATASSSSSSRR